MNYEIMRTISDDEWRLGLIERHSSLDWVQLLPDLPSDQIQISFTGKANAEAFKQSYAAVEGFMSGARSLGQEFNGNEKLLDFGCGWGRITQSAFRYFDPSNIIAADIQPNALEIVRKSNLKVGTLLVENFQIDLPNESVDSIFAYSVFSHLSERSHLRWLKELHRVLKPGGCIALTTRWKNMIEHVQNLSTQTDISASQKRLVESFQDPEVMLKQFEDGEFVFRPYPSNASGLDEEYGEAFITQKYIQNNWDTIFNKWIYLTPLENGIDQAVVVVRKGS